MATKSYALSKSKVVEMITEKLGETGQVQLEDVLAIFTGRATGGSTAGSTMVYDEKGNVIGKRCSYFGVFMSIDEFGKRGDTYAFQSKLAESLVRKARTEAMNKKKLVDDELADEVITVSEWKAKLAEIEQTKEARIEIADVEGAPVHFETAEELKEELA